MVKKKRINSRNKGVRGERALAKFLGEHGYETRRGQQYSGANGDADVVGIKGMHIECKWVEDLDLKAAMEQSVSDARDGEFPIVFHKKNYQDWQATFLMHDFVELWSNWAVPRYIADEDFPPSVMATMDAEDFLIAWKQIKGDQ